MPAQAWAWHPANLLRRIPSAWLACLLLPVICLPVGCGRPAGKIFTPLEPEIVWPLPPEPPRIKCLGEIRSSEDLHSAKSGWQVLQERLHPEESRPIPLTKPHAIAVHGEDRVYVVDTGLACLHVIDLERRTHRRVDSAGGDRLRSPVGVAVGASGVYVTDAMLGDVIEFNFDGEFQRRLGVEMERPAGIAYCSTNKRLYVIDTAAHECLILGPSSEEESDWTIVGRFGERGTEPGTFNFPTHVTWNPLLGLVVSDTLNFRVQRFDADGKFRAGMGQKGDGAGDFSLPKGVAVDRDGHIYVVDAHFENVQVFDQSGRLLLAFGSEGEDLGQFAVPAGIAIDEADRIWVADSYNHRLQVFQYLGAP